jgi:hypothetical protein
MDKLTKRLIKTALLNGLFCVPFVTQATTLMFDSLPASSPPTFSAVPENYGSLYWGNFFVGTVFDNAAFSPFTAALVSPKNVIFNSGNAVSVFSRAIPFQFNSAYLTALGNNQLNMEVRGYRDGVAVESKFFLLDASTPARLVTFNWPSVDTVQFTPILLTTNGSIFGSQPYFAIDDLRIDEPVIIPYTFSGFQPPVNTAPVINIGKAGRTYPVKWQLKDQDGNFVSALTAVKAISLASVLCGTFASAPADGIEIETTGETILRYDTETNQFVYNWKTPRELGCYMLFFTLDTGDVLTAKFNLTK